MESNDMVDLEVQEPINYPLPKLDMTPVILGYLGLLVTFTIFFTWILSVI